MLKDALATLKNYIEETESSVDDVAVRVTMCDDSTADIEFVDEEFKSVNITVEDVDDLGDSLTQYVEEEDGVCSNVPVEVAVAAFGSSVVDYELLA